MKHTWNDSFEEVEIVRIAHTLSRQFQASYDTLRFPTIVRDAFDHPGDCLSQCFSGHCATGLPNGRQAFERPRTRTALPHLMHEKAVR